MLKAWQPKGGTIHGRRGMGSGVGTWTLVGGDLKQVCTKEGPDLYNLFLCIRG